MGVVGYRMLESKRNYGLVLMGGAVGLMYLDVFFAIKLFQIISAPVAFVGFAALGVATLFYSVRLEARILASLGLLGAFMAPVLASTGSGNHVMLFSYYLLLNAVIFTASWFRAWRELNLIGFLFTFAVALFWGASSYRPEHFSTVEPFLIAFFFMYLAIPIFFAHKQPPQLRGIVDGTLVFGMPLTATMMQSALTAGMSHHPMAWTSGIVALVYGVLAWRLWARNGMRVLAEAHLALALVFVTATPYFAWNGYPTFAFWALESAAIYWIACRQNRLLARLFALCLQVGAAGYFPCVTPALDASANAWLNEFVLGAALIGFAAVLTGWLTHHYRRNLESWSSGLGVVLVIWSAAWLLFAGMTGVTSEWASTVDRLAAALILVSALVCTFEWLGRKLEWNAPRYISITQGPAIVIVALMWAASSAGHPLPGAGVFAWPIAFIGYFFCLYRQRKDQVALLGDASYLLGWTAVLLVATWETAWRQTQSQHFWVWGVSAAVLVGAAIQYRRAQHGRDSQWSHEKHAVAAVPLVWSLVFWTLGLVGVVNDVALPSERVSWYLLVLTASVIFIV